MNDPAVQSLPQSDREAFEAFCREKWGDDLNHALVERCQAAAAWLAARDFYAAHPSLDRERLATIIEPYIGVLRLDHRRAEALRFSPPS